MNPQTEKIPGTDFLFRTLTVEEEEEFRQYARENDPPENWILTHPVCRNEWRKLGKLPA